MKHLINFDKLQEPSPDKGFLIDMLYRSYYNLDLSFCLSVYQLLRQFWTNRAETWQECRARSRIEPKGIGFHGNHMVVMIFNKNCAVTLISQ